MYKVTRGVLISLVVLLTLCWFRYADARIVNECASNTTKLEVQSWWVPNFGHIHATTCYPLLRQFNSETMRLNVRIVLHHNPGHLFKLRFDNGSGDLVAEYPLNLGCVYDETCAFNVPVELPVSKFRSSGLRIRASVNAPDGKRFVTSSDLPIAGGAENNIQGKGWYDGIGYAIAKIHPDSVPLEAVSGTHVFKVKTRKASDQFVVSIDKSHGVPAAQGGFWEAEPASAGKDILVVNGRVSDWTNIPVDTTELSNGWHTISFKSRNPEGTVSHCIVLCNGESNHLHGVLKLWFYVQN